MSAIQCRRCGGIDLQQPSQERNVVCPFLLGSVPEGQRALDAGGISSKALVFLVQSCPCQYLIMRIFGVVNIQSSAALRVARGAGLERPDPGGEKRCRLAVGSADILCVVGYAVSMYL
jgi:hypothetical protein